MFLYRDDHMVQRRDESALYSVGVKLKLSEFLFTFAFIFIIQTSLQFLIRKHFSNHK